MSNLSPHIWGQLPPELIREIMLFLARMDVTRAHYLRLISNEFNVLILPILFRHVVMLRPEHINNFTTTLLPKRKIYIPALKSKLHFMPRMLSTYKVDTWVLAVNSQRPSLETALASVAPVFTSLTKLAITGQNLSSNAFWLRKNPIHPTVMLLVHYGSPHLVNYYDPIFKDVTHFYTSITHGHRYSTVADLPSLTHLAVSTRSSIPTTTARNLAASLKSALEVCTKLKSLVFIMNFDTIDDPNYHSWTTWLAECLTDKRFTFLPDYRLPRMEWRDIVNGGKTLWDRALEWKRFDDVAEPTRTEMKREALYLARKEYGDSPGQDRCCTQEWEIDLVQRDNYHPQPLLDDPDMLGPTGFDFQAG